MNRLCTVFWSRGKKGAWKQDMYKYSELCLLSITLLDDHMLIPETESSLCMQKSNSCLAFRYSVFRNNRKMSQVCKWKPRERGLEIMSTLHMIMIPPCSCSKCKCLHAQMSQHFRDFLVNPGTKIYQQ